MGFFSWKTADSKLSVANNSTGYEKPVYLLQQNGEEPYFEPSKESSGSDFPVGTPFRLLLRQNSSIQIAIPAFAEKNIIFCGNGETLPSIVIKEFDPDTRRAIEQQANQDGVFSVMNLFTYSNVIETLSYALHEGDEKEGSFYLLKPEYMEQEVNIKDKLVELDCFHWDLDDAYSNIAKDDLEQYYERIEYDFTVIPETEKMVYNELEREVVELNFDKNDGLTR